MKHSVHSMLIRGFAASCLTLALFSAQVTLAQPATSPATAPAVARHAYDERFHIDMSGGPDGGMPFDPFSTRLTLSFHPPDSAMTAQARGALLKMADEADAEIERVWSAAKTPEQRQAASERLNQMLRDRGAAAQKLITPAAAQETQGYSFIVTGEWMALEQQPGPFLDMVLNELNLSAQQKAKLKPIIDRAKQKLPPLQKARMENMGVPGGGTAAEKAYRDEVLKTLEEINGSLNKEQITRLIQTMMAPAPQK